MSSESENSRKFFHDYPKNKFITAVHYTGIKEQRKWIYTYEIISLGYYPSFCKKTQKNRSYRRGYDIPDNYIVKLKLWQIPIILKTKYNNSNEVKFSLSWNNNGSFKTVESKKSGTDLIKLFCKVNYLKI